MNPRLDAPPCTGCRSPTKQRRKTQSKNQGWERRCCLGWSFRWCCGGAPYDCLAFYSLLEVDWNPPIGTWTETAHKTYWKKATVAQLNQVRVTPLIVYNNNYSLPHSSPSGTSDLYGIILVHKFYSWLLYEIICGFLCRSDCVFMGFPSNAYCGASTKNKTLLTEAYKQCKLYRTALHLSSGLIFTITMERTQTMVYGQLVCLFPVINEAKFNYLRKVTLG